MIRGVRKVEHQGSTAIDTSLAKSHYNEELGRPLNDEDSEPEALMRCGQGQQGPLHSLRTVRSQAVRMPEEECGQKKWVLEKSRAHSSNSTANANADMELGGTGARGK